MHQIVTNELTFIRQNTIYIYTHTHTTNVSPILFISTKTINRYSQHEGRHDEHTYCLLDLKFQNETYMIHIFICIFLDIKIFWCQTWIKIFLLVFTQFVVCIEISTMLPQCIKKKHYSSCKSLIFFFFFLEGCKTLVKSIYYL